MKTPVFGQITSLCLLLAAGASVARADVLTWDPLLNNGGGGTGTWNLNGTANWYNGTTDEKWLDNSANGTNSAIFAGTSGTVTLSSALSASNLQFTATGYTLSGASTLTLGAGGIDASTLASGTTTISLALSLPQAQQAWQSGAGGILAINGAVTRATGASVDFSATGITSSSLNNDATGILGAWATVGNFVPSNATGDWAAKDGSGNIIPYAGYTLMTGTVDGSTGAAQNWENAAAGNVITFTGNANLNSLVQQGDVIVSNNFTLTIGSGGLILKGISRWLIDDSAFTIGSASIKSGSPNGEFFIHTPNGNVANNGQTSAGDGGNWRIWPSIKDNGATPLVLIKDGPGCVSIQNTNTYTGGSIVNNGILVAGGADTTVNNAPYTLGSGIVTINPHGIMEIGYGTADATRDYLYPNNVILNGGKILSDDGHNHVTGTISVTANGGTLGSTYDGGGSGTTGNKALFIDGIVSGSGPLTLQQAVDAGDNDRYGNGGGNPYNSSVVEFVNPGNTYSGTITQIPYSTGTGAGSYVTLNSSTALQFATLNLSNNPGGHRYGGFNAPAPTSATLFSPLVFTNGLGTATVANIIGTADIILNGFNENTYRAVAGDGVTLVVGNSINTSYSGNITGDGSLTKQGTSTLTLNGQNTFGGVTTVANGTLVLSATSSWLASSNVVIATGKTLNASALGTITLNTNQSLLSDGTLIATTVNTGFGSAVYGGTDLVYGTNTITGGLNLALGAVAVMDVGTTASGANDRVNVGGALTANNNVIHLKAPSTAVNLDTTADYLLFSAASISGAFTTTPTWDVAPLNAPHYSIQTSNKAVYLHYNAIAGPSGSGNTTPNPTLRNQSMLITVNAINGTVDTVSSVVVDASSVGGSATLSLVNSGGNVWTNSITIPTDLAPGIRSLQATLTGSDSLSAFVNVLASIVANNDVWNGGGADQNLSTALNWTNHLTPALIGDSLQFAGSTGLTPNVDLAYVVTGILFTTNAGAFNIGSASSMLTITNGTGVVNNSANVQTLSTPIALGAQAPFATASNDIVVNGVISDGGTAGGLTKSGTHTLTLSGANTYTGPTRINNGTLNLTGSIGTTAANTSSLFVGNTAGKAIVNLPNSASLSAFYLLLGNTNNAVAALYQTGGTLDSSENSTFDNLSLGNVAGGYGYYAANGGTFNVNGICIGGEANNGGGASFSSPGGNGIMEINGGAVTDVGWLVMARQNSGTPGPSTGILNIYSGSLSFAGGGLVGPWQPLESATINILGGTVTSGQGIRLGNTGFLGTLNLNGGLTSVSDLSGYNGPAYAIVNAGLVNFNGGVLQASAASTNFIHVTRATVYSGGLTFDNNGNFVVIQQPLLAPTGGGVNGIASFTPGAGYIAPPIVTITNGVGDATGNGATAIAQINPATGTVTNVVITSPGVNYTVTPVFLLSGGGPTTAATITGKAPTASIGGGVAFIGASLTELDGVSTYTGNTTVGSGSLLLTNSSALPATTTVILTNGGTLALAFPGTQSVNGLVVNGVVQTNGVYNFTNSPSFFQDATALPGGGGYPYNGSLRVTPATVIAGNSTNITAVAIGGGTAVGVSWPADHLGWILQMQTNSLGAGSNWVDVAGTATITSTNMPVTPGLPHVFYRIRHP